MRRSIPSEALSRRTRRFALLTSILVLASSANVARGEVRFVPLDPERVATMKEAAPTPAPRPLDGPATVLLLPYFEIDATQFAQTALLGIRNNAQLAATTLDVTYYDVSGNLVAVDSGINVPGAGVYTRNLRDVPGLPTDPDGFKRGFAYAVASSPVSGDFFQVDPLDNFATGSRMVDGGERCFIYDLRYLSGGPFAGGTRFQLFVDSPLGAGSGDPPTASFTISGEDGTIFGAVGIRTDQMALEFGITDLLAALPGGIGPNFGSALVVISASAGHGLLHATYSAEGLYSIGMPASCQTPAP